MRYRFLLILLVLSLSACSFQARIVTPEPFQSIETETTQSVILPPADTITPASLPTVTSAPPTFTSTALPQVAGVYPIRFSPNGTYIDIPDTIPALSSKTYSITALRGQVMSISVHEDSDEWSIGPMTIVGADGESLCQSCYFWRGTLPVTQDYFVTFTSTAHSEAINFTLRVAINPPGAATQTFLYESAGSNAALSYTDDFAPVRFPGSQIYKVEPEIALELIDTQFYAKTNLSEAYVLFGSTNNGDVVANCTQPGNFGGTETLVGNVIVNGNEFVRSKGGGVGLGNIYEQVYHRAVYNGYCYEVTFYIHYGNIGNYLPDAGIKEFDRTALNQKFDAILASLIIQR